MKKIVLLAFALALLLAGCAKKPVNFVTVTLPSTTTTTAVPPETTTVTAATTTMTTTEPVPVYPMEDEAGRLRCQIAINGDEPAWELLPFVREGLVSAFFPLEELLQYWQIPYQTEPTSQMLRASVNGEILLLQGGMSSWSFGEYSYNANVFPLWLDGTLYVPQYLLEEVFGAEIAGADGVLQISTAFRADPGQTLEEIELAPYTFGSGKSQLTISGDPLDLAVKIYKADFVGPDQQVMCAQVEKDGELTLNLEPGDYVIKTALGTQWLGENEAFGSTGYYRSSQITLAKGKKTALAELEQTDDTLAGFNGR